MAGIENLQFVSGSGRFKEVIKAKYSRASSEPEALAKDLKITKSVIEEKIPLKNKIIAIYNQIMRNSIMRMCFGSISLVKQPSESVDVIKVGLDKLSQNPRDAAKFLELSFIAASNAGFIRFTSPTIIRVEGDKLFITIQKSEKDKNKEKPEKDDEKKTEKEVESTMKAAED